MGNKAEAARQRIIDAADILFYQQGFDKTSFTDIASEVNISKGNFYYHFKTKNEILDAVIQYRLEKTRTMLDEWEQSYPDIIERIHLFIDLVIQNKKNVHQYGCPVGTLCSELAKIEHAMHDNAAEIFSVFRQWLIKQFTALGHPKKADQLSMHLLATSQGIATIMSTFSEDEFYKNEVKDLKQWVLEL